ncbi:MAG: polar amino acid transport system substrate-binding protein [Pseudomonadota bacterium]|nr:polar amino acid transport system substrate-binding protein [Pseudomonadota bacterium]
MRAVIKHWVLLSLAAACCYGPVARDVRADTFEAIQNRGKLIVGVKADVPLWGVLDKVSGNIVGLEPDLAQDLADQFGVKLELKPLLSAERVSALEQRLVDVVIATFADTPDRQTQVTMVLPHYYETGFGLLTRRSEQLKQWSDLYNRRVCSRRESFFNRALAIKYGVDVIALYSVDHAVAALRDGRCVGLIFSDIAIQAMLQKPEWSTRYEAPLPSLYSAPWAIGLHRDERDGRLYHAISRAVVRWHRSGLLARLEDKWGIPRSNFVQQMEQRWKVPKTSPLYCGDSVTASTPAECL